MQPFKEIRSLASRLLGRSMRVTPDCELPSCRIGSDYGGWFIYPDCLDSDSVVYSAGIGDDLSFDLGVIERFGCKVIGFDPTPRCQEWIEKQSLDPRFVFLAEGLAGHDGSLRLYPLESSRSVNHTLIPRPGLEHLSVEVPCRRISTIMKRVNHASIDLLKLDVEGAEYEIIDDMLQAGIRPKQLLVEFHHRFPGIGVGRTKNAVRSLRCAGYKVLASTPGAREISFII